MTAEDLQFHIRDVFLVGLNVDRGPRKPNNDALLQAQIGFDVLPVQFVAGETRLKVTTRFRASLFLGAADWPEDDVENSPNRVGTVETRFTANVDASRPVEEADAATGRLEAVLEGALPAMHPYHRALLESHTAMLGVSPLRLPVDWAQVAASLAASE